MAKRVSVAPGEGFRAGLQVFTVWQLAAALVEEDDILATWGKPIHGLK